MKLWELLFVHKENKNNDIIQQFFSSASQSATIDGSTTTHVCVCVCVCVCVPLLTNKANSIHVVS